MPKIKNLEILSPIKGLQIVSKAMADPDLLKVESTADYLAQGEWLVLNGSDQAARPSADPSTGEVGPYLFISEQGRSDTQAAGKVPLLLGSSCVIRTKAFLATPAAGTELEVGQGTFDGQTRSVLQAKTTGKVVGYVMEAKDDDGWLKVMVTGA